MTSNTVVKRDAHAQMNTMEPNASTVLFLACCLMEIDSRLIFSEPTQIVRTEESVYEWSEMYDYQCWLTMRLLQRDFRRFMRKK